EGGSRHEETPSAGTPGVAGRNRPVNEKRRTQYRWRFPLTRWDSKRLTDQRDSRLQRVRPGLVREERHRGEVGLRPDVELERDLGFVGRQRQRRLRERKGHLSLAAVVGELLQRVGRRR